MSSPQSDNFSVWTIFRNSDSWGKGALILSTWFGAGLIPFAPGTMGTLAATPLILLSHALWMGYRVAFVVGVVGIAVYSGEQSQKLLAKNDPSEVVIDEVAGFLLTMLFLPKSWFALGLGFVLFRVFDITKPYPIRHLERLPGGFGIVMDDLLAGFYAGLIGKISLQLVS
jgi:phosphatidylglycerophosphatase A